MYKLLLVFIGICYSAVDKSTIFSVLRNITKNCSQCLFYDSGKMILLGIEYIILFVACPMLWTILDISFKIAFTTQLCTWRATLLNTTKTLLSTTTVWILYKYKVPKVINTPLVIVEHASLIREVFHLPKMKRDGLYMKLWWTLNTPQRAVDVLVDFAIGFSSNTHFKMTDKIT